MFEDGIAFEEKKNELVKLKRDRNIHDMKQHLERQIQHKKKEKEQEVKYLKQPMRTSFGPEETLELNILKNDINLLKKNKISKDLLDQMEAG